jgi:hypothetical protein
LSNDFSWAVAAGIVPRLAEIEAFVDECRADPWFQSRPELVDRLERC